MLHCNFKATQFRKLEIGKYLQTGEREDFAAASE